MTNNNKELKKNASCEEMQEARELTPDELAKVTGGGPVLSGPMLGVTVKADGIVKASGTINGQAYAGTSDLVIQ